MSSRQIRRLQKLLISSAECDANDVETSPFIGDNAETQPTTIAVRGKRSSCGKKSGDSSKQQQQQQQQHVSRRSGKEKTFVLHEVTTSQETTRDSNRRRDANKHDADTEECVSNDNVGDDNEDGDDTSSRAPAGKSEGSSGGKAGGGERGEKTALVLESQPTAAEQRRQSKLHHKLRKREQQAEEDALLDAMLDAHEERQRVSTTRPRKLGGTTAAHALHDGNDCPTTNYANRHSRDNKSRANVSHHHHPAERVHPRHT